MKKCIFAAIALSAFIGSEVLADSISISSMMREVTNEEAADGAPAGGSVTQFFATTDADILALNFVRVETDAPLYQNPFGTPGSAPNALLVPTFPALAVDSFITTPGDTSVLGGGLPADGDDTFGDTSDDGPQNAFLIAQFTLPQGARGTFSGQLDIVGSTGVFSQEFALPIAIPEPATLGLLSLALVGVVASRRRS